MKFQNRIIGRIFYECQNMNNNAFIWGVKEFMNKKLNNFEINYEFYNK